MAVRITSSFTYLSSTIPATITTNLLPNECHAKLIHKEWNQVYKPHMISIVKYYIIILVYWTAVAFGDLKFIVVSSKPFLY